MLLVTAIGAVFAITRNNIASRVSQKLGADIRLDMFSKIINFSESSVDKLESGLLITRMTNDSSQVTQFINGLMRIFMKAPITCIGSIVLASVLNLKLSLIIYGVVALVSVLIIVSMKLSYPRFARLQQAMDRVNLVVQEYLIGVRLVKAFGTYKEECGRFDTANDDLTQKGISSQIIITLISPIMTLVVGIGTVLAIYFGSLLFNVNMVQPGEISAFTIYMSQMLGSLMMISNIFNVFVRTKASSQRIREVLDGEGDYSNEGQSCDKVSGDITFDHVTFRYPNATGEPVVNDLRFTVKRGERLAVIGPTGSGKSTLCWLLLRFYDIDSGKILLDGKDIRTLPIDVVRNSMAIIPQKPMLFSGTVEENIRWGHQSATQEDVAEAARLAQADFIAQMPQGFQSMLGSSAVNISGGQKQRISIARGLIKQAPVLILDDATSALDSITEAKVCANLSSMKAPPIIIMFTQRCTTVMFANKILVLEDGIAVGYGSHSELLSKCPVYADIYRSQVDSKGVSSNG